MVWFPRSVTVVFFSIRYVSTISVMKSATDPDEPVVHLYAEGQTPEQSDELERELESYLENVIEGEEITAPTGSREPEFSS